MFRTFLLALAASFCLSGPAPAQDGSDLARLDVRHGWRTAEGTHFAALQISMLPGWHTYWHTPGDAGLPPRITWREADNVAALKPLWPVPEVFRANGYLSIGYHDHLILPLQVVAKGPGPIRLRGEMSFGVCEEVCVPVTLPFAAELTQARSTSDPALQAALDRRPMSPGTAGVSDVNCDLSPTRDGLDLVASVTMPSLAQDEIAVVNLPDPSVWVSGGPTQRRGGTVSTRTELVPTNSKAFSVNRGDIRITVLGGGRAVEINGCQ